MNTYSKTSRTKINYRKIYTMHHGPIPKDSAGRQTAKSNRTKFCQ